MIYVDTSAFVKLVFAEPESDALAEYLTSRRDASLVSSALLAVEARRAGQRLRPLSLPRIDVTLTGVAMIQISQAVVESAGRLPGKDLRSLDAIHLATLLMIRDDVDLLLSYDWRLREAAESNGLRTVAPA